MREMNATEAREQWAELINRAAYGKEVVVITRHGRRLVAIVPAELVEEIEDEALAKEARQRLADVRAGREEVVALEARKPGRSRKK